MPTIITVSGRSGSGKTTIASRLHDHIKSLGTSTLMSCDDYYRTVQRIDAHNAASVNMDHPDSIEFELLASHLVDFMEGRPFDKPVYSFENSSRLDIVFPVEPSDYLVVDGILALHVPEIRKLSTAKIFVDAHPTICYERRLKRDVSERGRSWESVQIQWHTTVEPMALEFVEPSKQHADLIVSGLDDIETSLRRIIEHFGF